MGTAERKQKEKEERERLFLTRAGEMIRDEGLLNLQMARLAESCEYATGTLYQHFSSKEDLLVALAEQGAHRHVDVFRRALAWQAGTRDRMFAIAVGDVHFARKNPQYAKLIQYVFAEAVWENALPERRQSLLGHCEPITEIIRSLVREAIYHGDLRAGGSLHEMELALGPWCLCEGMHSLVHTQGLLEKCRIHRPEELLFVNVQLLLNGMGWQPLMEPVEPAATQALADRIRRDVFES